MRDLLGTRVGRLTVIEPAGSRNGRAVWRCKCDCGVETLKSSKHLISGNSRSCGCYRSDVVKALRASEAASFESRLQANISTGCLEWTGSRDRQGYGTVRTGGKDYKAHRVAYERACGTIPPGVFVCHKCDNPPCCNPDHLFLGDAKTNSEDAKNKMRHARGDQNGYAKVSKHTVKRIRVLAKEMSQQAVADLFGIHQTTVSKIILRKSWVHVE
jgi:hypothetical protein